LSLDFSISSQPYPEHPHGTGQLFLPTGYFGYTPSLILTAMKITQGVLHKKFLQVGCINTTKRMKFNVGKNDSSAPGFAYVLVFYEAIVADLLAFFIR